jgi:hypothetical protein
MSKMIINEDGVEREATAEEIAQHEIDMIEGEKYNEAIRKKVAAREALFARLGLTDEEAAAIFG